MLRRILLFSLAALVVSSLHATDSPRFRGATSDGIFAETGLLDSWPDGGPKLLWATEGLGETYASLSIADGRLYTTGLSEKRGKLFAFDLAGKRLWVKDYGEEFDGRGYPGTRNTPTLHDGSLYLLSSLGNAMALDAESGEVHWQVDVLERFKGQNTYFGLAESLLIVDGKVIVTPGGPDASVAALDAASGETVWTSRGLSDAPAYCTPRLYENGKHRQIITMVAKQMVGINPGNGEVLWRHPYEVEYDIHAVSPEFSGKGIFISHGYGQGSKLFELADDGKSVKEKWTHDELDVHHGGAVVQDGHIYGAASKKTWHSLDAASGKTVASIPRLGKGAMILADGHLYGYTEAGEVVLVNPDPAQFKVVSSFKIERGSGQHWSHPVISNGVLYIRHGEVLMAFDIKDRS